MSSEPIFVKIELRVLFEERTDTDHYREVIECLRGSNCPLDQEAIKRFKVRINKLEEEPEPSAKELYQFLISQDPDSDVPRYLDMINACVLWKPTYSAKIYLENEDVKISFVMQAEDEEFIETIEEILDDDPFFKSKVGGQVGNYCKFPSRHDPGDLLGVLNIVSTTMRVTDISGKTKWTELWEPLRDDSDDEEVPVVNPFVKEVDLDDEEVVQAKPKKPSRRFVPKIVRRLFTKSVEL
jgi:hypothetical protein